MAGHLTSLGLELSPPVSLYGNVEPSLTPPPPPCPALLAPLPALLVSGFYHIILHIYALSASAHQDVRSPECVVSVFLSITVSSVLRTDRQTVCSQEVLV